MRETVSRLQTTRRSGSIPSLHLALINHPTEEAQVAIGGT